jgi:hypothetical protein
MAGPVSITNVPKIFKDLFLGKATSMATRGKPMLDRIVKIDDMEGAISNFVWRANVHTGATHVFATAQSDDTANDVLRPQLTTANLYAVIDFDAKGLAGTRSAVGSYLRLKAKETQDQFEYVGQVMERELWRGASLGQLLAAPTVVSGLTFTFQMKAASDIVSIQKGQRIGAWTTASGAATQRTNVSATVGTVTKVNHGTNTVTALFNVDPTAGTVWTANDYLFTEGARNTTDTLGWTSIQDYIPATDPSSGESFKGVDRSELPNYYAGWRGTTYGTIEESVQQLAVIMAPYVNALPFGGTEVWLSPKNWQRLNAESGARLLRDQGGTAILGYKGFRIATAAGDFPVMTGPFVPDSDAFLLDQSTWELHTLGEFLHLVNEDGQEMLRKATADEFEMRWRSWAMPFCQAPVKNGRVAV